MGSNAERTRPLRDSPFPWRLSYPESKTFQRAVHLMIRSRTLNRREKERSRIERSHSSETPSPPTASRFRLRHFLLPPPVHHLLPFTTTTPSTFNMDYDEKKDYDTTNVTVEAARGDEEGQFIRRSRVCALSCIADFPSPSLYIQML